MRRPRFLDGRRLCPTRTLSQAFGQIRIACNTGAGSFQTCHRRFQQWVRFGVMTRIMTALAHELSIRGAIDVSEAFIDASFAPAKKGGAR